MIENVVVEAIKYNYKTFICIDIRL